MHNFYLGRNSFYELLRKRNLLIKQKKRYAITTNSNHLYYKWLDHMGNIKPTDTEQLWISDFTYLHTENGVVYLLLVTDCNIFSLQDTSNEL